MKNRIFLPLYFLFSGNTLTFAALRSIQESMAEGPSLAVHRGWVISEETIPGAQNVIMFAVVKIAGQQFKVQKDQTLYIPRVAGNTGDKIEFAEVLLANADGKLSVGTQVKTTIKAEILDQVQGDKVISFKMKRRKGFRKKHGHRTHYTKIKINDIV